MKATTIERTGARRSEGQTGDSEPSTVSSKRSLTCRVRYRMSGYLVRTRSRTKHKHPGILKKRGTKKFANPGPEDEEESKVDTITFEIVNFPSLLTSDGNMARRERDISLVHEHALTQKQLQAFQVRAVAAGKLFEGGPDLSTNGS